MAGFKTCSIHPFNRKILKAVPTSRSGGDQRVVDNTANQSSSVQKTNVQPTTSESMQSKQVPVEEEVEFDVLSPKLESLYEQRFEEGYNLSIDPKYNRWLKKKYP